MKNLSPMPLMPVPNVMVTAGEGREANIITIGWTGVINSEPLRVFISVRPDRHSYKLIQKTGEFVIHPVPDALLEAAKFCGSRSGRDFDKFAQTGLTKAQAQKVGCPVIAECPVALECRVFETKELGTHTMFLADIVAVSADEKYLASGRVDLGAMGLTCYLSNGSFATVKTISKRD